MVRRREEIISRPPHDEALTDTRDGPSSTQNPKKKAQIADGSARKLSFTNLFQIGVLGHASETAASRAAQQQQHQPRNYVGGKLYDEEDEDEADGEDGSYREGEDEDELAGGEDGGEPESAMLSAKDDVILGNGANRQADAAMRSDFLHGLRKRGGDVEAEEIEKILSNARLTGDDGDDDDEEEMDDAEEEEEDEEEEVEEEEDDDDDDDDDGANQLNAARGPSTRENRRLLSNSKSDSPRRDGGERRAKRADSSATLLQLEEEFDYREGDDSSSLLNEETTSSNERESSSAAAATHGPITSNVLVGTRGPGENGAKLSGGGPTTIASAAPTPSTVASSSPSTTSSSNLVHVSSVASGVTNLASFVTSSSRGTPNVASGKTHQSTSAAPSSPHNGAPPMVTGANSASAPSSSVPPLAGKSSAASATTASGFTGLTRSKLLSFGLWAKQELNKRKLPGTGSSRRTTAKVLVRKKETGELTRVRCAQRLGGVHSGAVWCAEFSPPDVAGRSYLATGGRDGKIALWEVLDAASLAAWSATGQQGGARANNNNNNNNNTFPLTSEASLGATGKISSNSLGSSSKATGEEGAVGSPPEEAQESVANVLVSGPPVFRSKPKYVWTGHGDDVVAISWSRGLFLASGSTDCTARLWHVSSPQCLAVFRHPDFVTSVDFHPSEDGLLLTGCFDRGLRVWSVPEGAVVQRALAPSLITAAKFNTTGDFVCAGLYTGHCVFYQLAGGGAGGLRYHTQIECRNVAGTQKKGRKVTSVAFVSVAPIHTAPLWVNGGGAGGGPTGTGASSTSAATAAPAAATADLSSIKSVVAFRVLGQFLGEGGDSTTGSAPPAPSSPGVPPSSGSVLGSGGSAAAALSFMNPSGVANTNPNPAGSSLPSMITSHATTNDAVVPPTSVATNSGAPTLAIPNVTLNDHLVVPGPLAPLSPGVLLPSPSAVQRLLTRSQEYMLVTTNDSRTRLYSMEDFSLVCKYRGAVNPSMLQIGAFPSPDARHVISGSEDRNVVVWRLRNDLVKRFLGGTGKRELCDSYESFHGTSSGAVTVAKFAPPHVARGHRLEDRRSPKRVATRGGFASTRPTRSGEMSEKKAKARSARRTRGEHEVGDQDEEEEEEEDAHEEEEEEEEEDEEEEAEEEEADEERGRQGRAGEGVADDAPSERPQENEETEAVERLPAREEHDDVPLSQPQPYQQHGGAVVEDVVGLGDSIIIAGGMDGVVGVFRVQ